jgi:hypothetical protein
MSIVHPAGEAEKHELQDQGVHALDLTPNDDVDGRDSLRASGTAKRLA